MTSFKAAAQTFGKPVRNSIRNRVVMLSLLLILSCSSPVTQATTTYRGNIFMEMMLAMMDVMGLINYERNSYNQPYPNFNSPAYGTSPYNFNSWQQMPGGGFGPGGWSSWANPGNLAGIGGNQATIPFLPEYFNQNPWQAGNPAARTHWIEGRWVANDNMIMEVRQGKFVMYYRDNPEQVRSGLIRLKDRWLAIAEETRKVSRQYEYAYKKDLLALRDTHGNLMLFRRLTDWPVPLR